jgi:putative NADH-flavin reductase
VEKVVNALRDLGDSAPRLIHVGGSGTLEVEPGVLYADKLPKILLPKKLELEIRGQVLALEYLRTVDDVKWSYATPAKNLTNGARTGEFRLGGDQLMENAKGKSRISRADFAVALVDEAENANYVRQRFSVAY